MNRRERLRRAIPGAPDELLDELAALSAHTVALIVAGVRQGKLDRERELAELRRRRKAEAARNRWYDEETLAARDRRLLAAAGRRAAVDLEALKSLAQFADHIRETLFLAVQGLRTQGYSDGEIGRALGITRQSVGERFGRKGNPDEKPG